MKTVATMAVGLVVMLEQYWAVQLESNWVVLKDKSMVALKVVQSVV